MSAASGRVMAGHPNGSTRQQGARAGDSSVDPDAIVDGALQTLHAMYSTRLLHYLIKLTLGDRRLAEDITQETFIRAWKHLRYHDDTDLDSFGPWLYTVARRLVVDTVRARRSRPIEVIVDDLTQLSDADDTIANLVTVQAVRDALMKLQPKQRTLLIEIYYYGRTPAEISKKLNIPLGTVKSRTHYAKRALRSFLDQQGFHPTLAIEIIQSAT